MSSAPFDLVIFDNDGVLVDSEGHAQVVTVFGVARVTPAAELVHATAVFTSMRELPALLGCASR